MPASRPKLEQVEVQDAIMALLRIATVWARRSYEDEGPLDRHADEELLRGIVELVRGHRNVPLVAASKATKVALRESAIRMVECHDALVEALKVARQARNIASQRANVSRRVVGILTTHGCACELEQVRVALSMVNLRLAPSTVAGKVMRQFGLWDYRSVAEARRELPALRAIAARRETTTLETIEYLLACLQVPPAQLYSTATALLVVLGGGQLTAQPRFRRRRPTSEPSTPGVAGAQTQLPASPSVRSSLRQVSRGDVPRRQRPYARYGASLLGSSELGVLDANDATPDGDNDDS